MRIFIFFALFILSFSYFLFQIYRRIRYIRLGKPEKRNDQRPERLKYLVKTVILQKRIAEYPLSGIFHSFIMWGFIVLIISSLDMVVLGLFPAEIPLLQYPWFLFIRDLFILLVLAGVIGFTVRRILLKIFKQNWYHSSFRAYAILILIFVIVLTELLYLSGNTVLTQSTFSGAWVVTAFSKNLNFLSEPALRIIMEICWWLHYLTIFSFLYIIPKSKHLHLVFAPFNIYWRNMGTRGTLQSIPLTETDEQTCGVGTVDDFTRKQLLDTFSCVLCGRCHRDCPAERSKERLKPKRLNGFIRSYLEDEGSGLLNSKPSAKVVGDIFQHDFIWSCTTCGGCNDACPVSIDHLSKIIDMRRNIVSEKNDVPAAMKEFFNHVEHWGNPFGKPRSFIFPDFPEKRNAEYLFYIGCQGTFDDRTRKTAETFAKILQSANVDFTILGDKEWCCGETARRMGNERLFQKTVKQNISSWKEYGFKKIITLCPHCFNTFKNEYPEFGGSYEVIPHTVFLADLLHQGKIKISSCQDITVTYHDSCYLGRYNDIFDQPRKILASIPGINLKEMPRNKKNSFCCGAGGGRFWTRTEKENPITSNRVDEALATDASVIVTSCPYCRTVFDEKINNEKQITLPVLDIAEILYMYRSDNNDIPQQGQNDKRSNSSKDN